jgi:hypothetical protein
MSMVFLGPVSAGMTLYASNMQYGAAISADCGAAELLSIG